MVDMGMDVGTTDLQLSARVESIYYMFYLELKTKDGELRESQIEWMDDFDKNFKCDNATRDVAYGFSEAKEKIIAWADSLAQIIARPAI